MSEILKELPDWAEAQLYAQMEDDEKNYSPLHQFIYDYEPAGRDEAEKFRSDLLELINHYLA